MSTLERDGAALLVIDVQNGVVADAHDRDAVVARIKDVVDLARAAGAAVVWVQHDDEELEHGSPQWEIVGELQPADDELIIEKQYGDSFEGTPLEDELTRLGVGHLVVTGAQTDACIRSTIHGGFVRGYDVTLVSDAHTTEDLRAWGMPAPDAVIAHTNGYWAHQDAPGRRAAVVSAAEVTFDA